MKQTEQEYYTPAGYGEAVLVEKKSRFIARVWPVVTESEAIGHIADMKREHWDANHNVYAYILRASQTFRYSDDGEPQGTSGLPTLGVFQNEQIYNVCCVITRYFGGILLGSGGLVRAYSRAAKMAVDAAGICIMRQWSAMLISCDYSLFESVRAQVFLHEGVIESSDFGVDVLLEVLVPVAGTEALSSALQELSAGAVKPILLDVVFRGVRME